MNKGLRLRASRNERLAVHRHHRERRLKVRLIVKQVTRMLLAEGSAVV